MISIGSLTGKSTSALREYLHFQSSIQWVKDEDMSWPAHQGKVWSQGTQGIGAGAVKGVKGLLGSTLWCT